MKFTVEYRRNKRTGQWSGRVKANNGKVTWWGAGWNTLRSAKRSLAGTVAALYTKPFNVKVVK